MLPRTNDSPDDTLVDPPVDSPGDPPVDSPVDTTAIVRVSDVTMPTSTPSERGEAKRFAVRALC